MTIDPVIRAARRVSSLACRLFLACLVLPAVAGHACAAEAGGGGTAPVLAEWSWWWWLGYFSNVGSRGNVITLCIVIVCLSLFILMKKFAPDGGRAGGVSPRRTP